MTFPEGLKRLAVMCVLKNENKFLLLKRLKEPNKDTYTPVGGKLDPHESPYKAALRETFEETGIKVEQMKFCGILTESSPTKYNWTCYVYLAEIEFIPPPPCNEGDLEWITLDNLLNLPTPKTDWFIYQYLLLGKIFVFNAEYDENLNLLKMNEEIENVSVFKF
ncbi:MULTISPECIES: NUDIX domain-containing protein [Emticicia]|uniref:NUDIX hydrolase n=1 Tax=Emticicia TaxID=312278 RepID=UPI0007D8ADFC|nr:MULTISPECIES: NUDIX domain-containing protein [Emticicia]